MQRFPDVSKAGIDATGILPSMWMAYKCPQLQNQFLQVVDPTTNNLRKIGMVEMQLVDERPPLLVGSENNGYHSVSANSSQVEVE
jgi:hypothetical protein